MGECWLWVDDEGKQPPREHLHSPAAAGLQGVAIRSPSVLVLGYQPHHHHHHHTESVASWNRNVWILLPHAAVTASDIFCTTPTSIYIMRSKSYVSRRAYLQFGTGKGMCNPMSSNFQAKRLVELVIDRYISRLIYFLSFMHAPLVSVYV